MAEKKEKKLQLNKETIRNLSDESLEQVAGGGRKWSLIACDTVISNCPGKSCVLIGAC